MDLHQVAQEGLADDMEAVRIQGQSALRNCEDGFIVLAIKTTTDSEDVDGKPDGGLSDMTVCAVGKNPEVLMKMRVMAQKVVDLMDHGLSQFMMEQAGLTPEKMKQLMLSDPAGFPAKLAKLIEPHRRALQHLELDIRAESDQGYSGLGGKCSCGHCDDDDSDGPECENPWDSYDSDGSQQ